MKKLLILFFLTVLFSLSAFAQGEINGRVVEIVDGRTVVIEISARNKFTAELQYIEVPEPDQPFYQAARDHLGQIVLGRQVAFSTQLLGQTKTVGRMVARGIDISQQMIRDGAAWYAIDQKTGQDSLESEIYQKTEAQARAEKLGVWSVADLKPPWQLRAERAEVKRQQDQLAQDEKAKKEAADKASAEALATATPVKKPVKPSPYPPLSSESQLLAASDPTIKLPATVKMVGGLLIGYNPLVKLGLIATPMVKADFADKEGNQALAVQILYLYNDADESKGRQSSYLMCVNSESKDVKFLKENNLIVTADDKKIVIGKAQRSTRQTDSGIKEDLTYKIERDVFIQIAGARNIEIKVGNYSKNLNSELQQTLYNLLQTSY